MCKTLPWLIFWLFLACPLYTQQLDWERYDQGTLQLARTHALIFGGWAVANFGSGLALMGRGEKALKHFHQMNAAWGAVNLSIAIFFYLHPQQWMVAGEDWLQTMRTQRHVERILALNIGLDLAYMALGCIMLQQSRISDKNPDLWRGFGASLIMQGAFLFVQDLVFYRLHLAHARQLEPLLRSLDINPVGVGLRLVF
jgi:hypothetical protein